MEKGNDKGREYSPNPENEGQNNISSNHEQDSGAQGDAKNFRQNDMEKRGFEGADEENTSVEEDLMEQVENLKKEKEELFARMQRLQADFDNYRKRSLAEQERCVQYATAEVFRSLLPVIDNFERALDSQDQGEAFAEGVEMIFKQLKESLEKEGLEKIEAEGKPFDPYIHEAVMHVESEGHEENVVIEEFQKGYKFKDKLIRPSMVKVAK